MTLCRGGYQHGFGWREAGPAVGSSGLLGTRHSPRGRRSRREARPAEEGAAKEIATEKTARAGAAGMSGSSSIGQSSPGRPKPHVPSKTQPRARLGAREAPARRGPRSGGRDVQTTWAITPSSIPSVSHHHCEATSPTEACGQPASKNSHCHPAKSSPGRTPPWRCSGSSPQYPPPERCPG